MAAGQKKVQSLHCKVAYRAYRCWTLQTTPSKLAQIDSVAYVLIAEQLFYFSMRVCFHSFEAIARSPPGKHLTWNYGTGFLSCVRLGDGRHLGRVNKSTLRYPTDWAHQATNII